MVNQREEEFKKLMKEFANDTLITWILEHQFKNDGHWETEIRSRAELIGDTLTFEHLSPAESDFAVQELRDAIVRPIERARALATGERFDPERFLGRAD